MRLSLHRQLAHTSAGERHHHSILSVGEGMDIQLMREKDSGKSPESFLAYEDQRFSILDVTTWWDFSFSADHGRP